MNLISDELRAQLLANGRQSLADEGFDPPPVVKLFTPDAGATWLLTEIDPDDEDHAFGLCDLGLGFPELGYVSLAELTIVRGRLGLLVELDLHFTASADQCLCTGGPIGGTHRDVVVQQALPLGSAFTSPAGLEGLPARAARARTTCPQPCRRRHRPTSST